MTMPHELAFLDDYLSDSKNQYRKAKWLLSDFDDTVWKFSFDFKSPGYIDWQVKLHDGSNLTDAKNSELLNGLKYWVISFCVSSAFYAEYSTNSTSTQYIRFNTVFHIIDYLLINDDYFKLYKFGLSGLSIDSLTSILHKLSKASAEESLFGWKKTLIELCRNLLKSIDQSEIDSILLSDIGNRFLDVSPDDLDEAEELGVDSETIPFLRLALYVNDLTYTGQKGRMPNSIKISNLVYERSVRVKNNGKSLVYFLVLSNDTKKHKREYPGVKVTTGESDSISIESFRNYKRCLYNLGLLHEIGLRAPPVVDLIEMNNVTFETAKSGRFRTIPSSVVFDAFRGAIEFHFKYGRDIINAYLRLAIFAMRNGCNVRQVSREDFDKAIGPKLKELGVKYASLDYLQLFRDITKTKEEYFSCFRKNEGLHELLLVYFGATQLVVGALTARRVGELFELLLGGAVDLSGGWIVFNNRKSTKGLMGLRAREARPIEPIAVDMMQEIERFHRVLNRIGFGGQQNYLFSSPHNVGDLGRRIPDSHMYNRHLDLMCDYLQTALDSEGRRYYIRQHQLRRFFAILFFYSRSFGGLETLQWMLGHTNVSHVWHYITETIGGDVLRGAKSQYVAESLHRNGTEDFKELGGLIQSRYGTDDFTLLDTEELEDYVAELLEEGDIEIEPEFFQGPQGEDFKVVVKVKEIDGVTDEI